MTKAYTGLDITLLLDGMIVHCIANSNPGQREMTWEELSYLRKQYDDGPGNFQTYPPLAYSNFKYLLQQCEPMDQVELCSCF